MEETTLDISYRGVARTESIEKLIGKHFAKLKKVCKHIVNCHVILEKPHGHSKGGTFLQVCLKVSVPPEHELVVTRNTSTTEENHAPVVKAIVTAFKAAKRQVQKMAEKRRGDIKTHSGQEFNGIISKLFKNEGYGFLTNLEGREIYFHRNSVFHNVFDRLETGNGVYFVEESGEEGPQASTVRVFDKHGHDGPSLAIEAR